MYEPPTPIYGGRNRRPPRLPPREPEEPGPAWEKGLLVALLAAVLYLLGRALGLP